MERKKEELGFFFSLIIGVVVLCLTVIPKLFETCTIWELGDEAGYLANAAYFAGYDWDGIRGLLSYYGYGYSLFLIPLFIICKSGLDVIHGAMLVNVMFDIGTYLIITKLLIGFKNRNISKISIPIIALIVCLLPYLTANTIKVFPESCSVFFYSFSLLNMRSFIAKKNVFNGIVLGFNLSVLFFVHTRLFVVIGVTFALVLFAILITNKDWKKLIAVVVSFVLVYIVMYMIKNNILESTRELASSDVVNGNLLTGEYVGGTFERLFSIEAIRNLLLSTIAKVFYTFYETFGMAFYAIFYIIKEIKQIVIEKKKYNVANLFVQTNIIASWIMMTLAVSVNYSGMDTNNAGYIFYGRYYECTVIALFALGIYMYIANGKDGSERYAIVSSIFLFKMTLGINDYIEGLILKLDTNRGAAWGLSTNLVGNREYLQVVFVAGIILLTVIIFMAVIKKINKYIVLILLLILNLVNSKYALDTVVYYNKLAEADTYICEYILDDDYKDEIYMLDDNAYVHRYFYVRMQALSKDNPIKVVTDKFDVEINEIDANKYILTYHDSDHSKYSVDKMSLIMEGAVFDLWIKNDY